MSQKKSDETPQPVSGKVLVKFYTLHPNSSDVDSGSIHYNYFDPEIMDEYEREDEKSGKTNYFHDQGLKYEIVKGKDTEIDTAPKELEVDGVKFTVTKDAGGFSAAQVNGGNIELSNKTMKGLKDALSEQIKLTNAE